MNDFARFSDIADKAKKQGIAYTPFLSMELLSEGYSIARVKNLLVSSFGGFEGAERKILCYYDYDKEPDFPIDCILISSRNKLTHSQVLGSVIGLGLERDTLGDIVINDSGVYLFCQKHIVQFIVDNLQTVGREHVKAKLFYELPILESAVGENKRITIPSLRLDALLSAALNLSRTKAALIISQGRVFRNHTPESKADRRIDEDDIISIRGAGRIKLVSIGQITKKGKIPLQIETYLNNRRRL